MSEPAQTQGQVTEILELLRQTRAALSFTLPSSDLVYTSILLEIRPDHLLVDQLVPVVGDQLLQPGMSVQVRSIHQGVAYSFRAQHVGSSVDGRGFPFHGITRPEQIESQDKRASFRIPIRRSETPDCRIAIGSGRAIQARVEDLSEGGACLRTRTDQAPSRIGDAVDFALDFKPQGGLHCQARVCYVQPVSRSNQTRVGISFRGLTIQEVKTLRRLLMWLQRRNIKTGPVE